MAVVLEWVETGRVFPLPLGRPVVIGRGHHAEIGLDNRSVSRRHCQAYWDGCRVQVRELEGGRSTWITAGAARVQLRTKGRVPEGGATLRLGDVLCLGQARLRLGTPSRVEAVWLARQGGLVETMARHADESGDFGGLPVLADALEEAGCTDADLLAHCRSGGGHLRGCWAVDLLLGKS
jgi:hypothetical protein